MAPRKKDNIFQTAQYTHPNNLISISMFELQISKRQLQLMSSQPFGTDINLAECYTKIVRKSELCVILLF